MTAGKLWAGLWVEVSGQNLRNLLKTNGGRYRIRTNDFHRVKLTANGKQRTSEESSVIASSVHRALGAPSNENCAQICTQILDGERLAPSPKSQDHQRISPRSSSDVEPGQC